MESRCRIRLPGFTPGKDFFDVEDALRLAGIVQRVRSEQRRDLLLDLFGYQSALPGKNSPHVRLLAMDRTAFHWRATGLRRASGVGFSGLSTCADARQS